MVQCNKIDSGGFADIFKLDNQRVLKAYRRKPHINGPVVNWSDHDLLTKAHFRAEASAYKRLQGFENLKAYLPSYYGQADPMEILKLEPDSNQYVRGCGLILEFIPGRAMKLNLLENKIEEKVDCILSEINEKLSNVNVWDASCFCPGPRTEFTLIDFALWESREYEEFLQDNPRLSTELREKLLRENAH